MKKKLAKFMSMIMIAALIVTGFTGFTGNTKAYAAEGDTPLLIATAEAPSEATVYVTISNKGDLVVRQQSVTVMDIDDDGALTVSDALYCAHEKYYKGGAAEGYGAEVGQWGLGVTKLWGDTSGNFGYYVNDIMSMGAGDPINDGDYLNAWVYSKFSYDFETGETDADAYSFFNTRKLGIKIGQKKTIRLYYVSGFDASYAQINSPLKNAVITIGGEPTEYGTSKKGGFKFSATKSGSYFISAFSEDVTIVPPTLLIFVQPEKGEVIEVKNKKYTVTKLGTVKTGKKGKVTFSKSANEGKEAPKTVEYAGVTYKVKVVD